MSKLSMSTGLSGYREHVSGNRFKIYFGSTLTVRASVTNNTSRKVNDIVLYAHSGRISESSSVSIEPGQTKQLSVKVQENIYGSGSFDVYAKSRSNPSVIVASPITYYVEEFTTPTPPPTSNEYYTLNIKIEGRGSVNKSPNQLQFKKESIVDLSYTPNSGWRLDESKTSREIINGKVLMNESKVLHACFVKEITEIIPVNDCGTSSKLVSDAIKSIKRKDVATILAKKATETNASKIVIQSCLFDTGFDLGNDDPNICIDGYLGLWSFQALSGYLLAKKLILKPTKDSSSPNNKVENNKLINEYYQMLELFKTNNNIDDNESDGDVWNLIAEILVTARENKEDIFEIAKRPLQWPCKSSQTILTSDYQYSRSLPNYDNNGNLVYRHNNHRGIDVGFYNPNAINSKTITAVDDGKIIRFSIYEENDYIFNSETGLFEELYELGVNEEPSRGSFVDIEHTDLNGNVYYSRYQHLERLALVCLALKNCKRDYSVMFLRNIKRGDKVGIMGGSGGNFATHLHYELTRHYNPFGNFSSMYQTFNPKNEVYLRDSFFEEKFPSHILG